MTVTSLKISRYHKDEHVDRPENGGVAKLKRKKKRIHNQCTKIIWVKI